MIKFCQNCKKEFKTNRSKRKFCSHICAMTAPWNTTNKRGNKNVSKRPEVRKKMSLSRKGKINGDKVGNWKGDNASYAAIHIWLRKTFGKPDRCENPNCQCKNPKRFTYALLKNKTYQHKRENFIMLCPSCHSKYDFTEETRLKQRKSRLKYLHRNSYFL